MNRDGGSIPLDVHHVGQIVDKIGHTAGVVVNAVDGKTASAHDLRRTFGTRWASRVKTPVLQRLMRHANIGTTMQYYVALDVDDMADELWASHPAAKSNIFGNIEPESAAGAEATDDVTISRKRAYQPK